MTVSKGSPPPSSATLDILNGHLGNLTPDQERQLDAFREDLARTTKVYTPADKEDTAQKASHDDPTLLRFLRARSWDIAAAREQFISHEEWLKKHKVRRALGDLSPEEMAHTQKLYPRWTGRRDKLGIPVFVYRIASLKPLLKEILAQGQSEKGHQKVAALTEFMTLFHLPLCTHLAHPAGHIPISSTVSIVDLESAPLGLLWQLRSHFQQASQMNTENYPETISRLAVVNAPSFFYIIWNWLKTWFDPHTQSKVIVLGKDPGPTLTEFIDPADLPKRYGGKMDWEFEDEPSLDEDAKRIIGEMPQGPAAFVDGRVTRTIPGQADEQERPQNV